MAYNVQSEPIDGVASTFDRHGNLTTESRLDVERQAIERWGMVRERCTNVSLTHIHDTLYMLTFAYTSFNAGVTPMAIRVRISELKPL